MIDFNFAINNPWSKEEFKNLCCKEAKFFDYKAYSFQITYYPRDLLNFSFCLTHRCDHAGLNIEFGLLGYSIRGGWYDTRHWDYENHCWQVYK